MIDIYYSPYDVVMKLRINVMLETKRLKANGCGDQMIEIILYLCSLQGHEI